MTFLLESLRELVGTFPYSFILPMIGAAVGGEGIIIFFSALASAGVLPFWLVVAGSYTGTMVSDSFWFWFGGHFFNWLKNKGRAEKGLATASYFTDVFMRGRYFRTLFITKFLYGTRILTISYFSHKGLPFWRFTMYNVIATGLLTLVVCNIGFWIGQGIVKDNTLENLRFAVLTIVIVVVVLHILRLYLSKLFFNKTE